MRVFVTGASGHIGSALVPELRVAGHKITALARSDTAAEALAQAGAEVRLGTLDNVRLLREAAAEADGVIHLAYLHDAPAHVDAAAVDLRAINAISAALAGSGKPFVGTSGTMVLLSGHFGSEQDPPDPAAPAARRGPAEEAAVALARRGVRSSVVRLAPAVHSSLDHHGFVPALIDIARRAGVSAYVADGANRWPAVHTLDAARLYRLALETAPAGTRWHGAADQGVAFRDIAEVIGRRLNLPVTSIPPGQAAAHFGWLSFAVPADNPTTSSLTRQLLGWHPQHPGLLADLAEGRYFT